GLRAGDGGDPHERRRRSAARAEPLALWQRRVGLHRKRRRGALRDGKRERRNGWRERRRPGAARAVQLWRLERIEVRGRRHHRPRLDRVLDEVEEDDNEVEQGSRHQLDVVGSGLSFFLLSTDCSQAKINIRPKKWIVIEFSITPAD